MILLDFSLFAASVDELLCNKQVFSLEKVDFDTACPECDSFNDDVSGY
jgi:Zn finger protein HypA/HybF involved in hydrogenase expression